MLILLSILCSILSFTCSFAQSNSGLVKKYHRNEIWVTPSHNAAESMPLGGGDMGCNVWVEDGDLMLYVQRSGAFSEQGEFLKLGRLRITLSNNPFENYEQFTQEHNLVDGNIKIRTLKQGVKTEIILWVDIFNNSLNIAVECNERVKVNAAYENWRFRDRPLVDSPQYRGRFSCFQFEYAPYNMTKYRDSISFIGDNSVLFYHRNKEYSESPQVMISEQDLEKFKFQIPDYNANRTSGGVLWGRGFMKAGNSSGVYQKTPYRSWVIESEKAKREHHLFLTTNIEQTATIEEWRDGLENKRVIDSRNSGSKEKNIKWWNQFWDKSFIIVDPNRREEDSSYYDMGRNYQLFRYQWGGNMYGDYPTRFNGGNLTVDPCLTNSTMSFDPDWRAWGGDVFTMQNQRLIYWPMLKSGDVEGIKSELSLFTKALPGALIKTKEYFNHSGAMFTEYMHSSGMDLTCVWGWNKEHPNSQGLRLRWPEVQFADSIVNSLETRGKNAERYVEEGMLGGAISYHWMGQVEHTYMILEMRRYTGMDISEYMPLIKESLIFINEHYKVRQRARNGSDYGIDGKLVIFPSTACESYKGAKDPVDLVSGLYASLEELLKEHNRGYLSREEVEYFNEFLNHLPDLSLGDIDGDTIILPADFYGRGAPDECPQFYPLFPFNRYSLGDSQMSYFTNAWKHGTFYKDRIISWHQDGIFYARMGMVDDASRYNRLKLANSNRRFPTFWGPGHDWVPDHNWGGSGAIGLQEMLLQTIGDKIHILPCWPKGKDVIFKLHAPYNTIVEVEYINGEIQKCNVIPKSREKDVIVGL